VDDGPLLMEEGSMATEDADEPVGDGGVVGAMGAKRAERGGLLSPAPDSAPATLLLATDGGWSEA
jgi:hypothetical protein